MGPTGRLSIHQPLHLLLWHQLCQASAQAHGMHQHHAPDQVPQRNWRGQQVVRRQRAFSDQRHVMRAQPRPQQRACPRSSPAPAHFNQHASWHCLLFQHT